MASLFSACLQDLFLFFIDSKSLDDQYLSSSKTTSTDSCVPILILLSLGVNPFESSTQGVLEHETIKISDIKISNSHKWQKIHWQALLSSYNSSPFFEHYKDNFFDFYHTPQSNLFELNFKLTQTILSILQIEKKINS